MSTKKVIHAIHDIELEQFMKDLELLDDFIEGKLRCFICEKIIDEDNLGAFLPYKGDIKIICNDIDCYNKILVLRRDDE